MVKINKVYTRTGDQGDTGLVDGSRVAQDSLRVEAYGAVDELNAALGLARVWNDRGKRDRASQWLDGVLRKLQDELFDLGSELASPPGFDYPGKFVVGAEEIRALEAIIDRCTAETDPLTSFILPGGGPVSGFLHLARTVARRAERDVLRLVRDEPATGTRVLAYLNRLSDLLFVLSRWAGKHRGETEYLWERGLRAHAAKRRSASRRPTTGRASRPASGKASAKRKGGPGRGRKGS